MPAEDSDETNADGADQEVNAAADTPEDAPDEQEGESGRDEDATLWIPLGGDEALTVTQAHEVAASRGAHVVLVAGEYEAGKTTLVVELYAQFLKGPFDQWDFAGSRTLRALDARHHPTRAASGRKHPTTDRTQDEDMRLLHLRIKRNGEERVLMPSDVRGEFFEHVIDGASVGDEVPLAARADKTLLLVDGEQIADRFKRQGAVMRARMLVAGLTEQGGLATGRPLAIALSKADLVDGDARTWFDEEAAALAEWTSERLAVPTILHVAARPSADPDNPRGLEDVLRWLTHVPSPSSNGVSIEAPERAFWRLGVV